MEVYDIILYDNWENMTLCLTNTNIYWFLNDFQDEIFYESPMIIPD